MRIIALLDEESEVKRALKDLGLSSQTSEPQQLSRSPPDPELHELTLDLSETQLPPDHAFLN